jgi:hypothetical protein
LDLDQVIIDTKRLMELSTNVTLHGIGGTALAARTLLLTLMVVLVPTSILTSLVMNQRHRNLASDAKNLSLLDLALAIIYMNKLMVL